MSNADQIEYQIEHLRARLRDRLELIEARLTPGNLVQEAAAVLDRQFGGGRPGNRTLPLIVTGVGIVWLAASVYGRRKADASGRSEPAVAHAPSGAGAARATDGSGRDASNRLGDDIGEIKGRIEETIEAAKGLAHKAQDSVDDGYSAARGWAGRARDEASRLQRKAQPILRPAGDFAREHPWALIAAGLAAGAGAAAGMSYLRQRRERRDRGRRPESSADAGAETLDRPPRPADAFVADRAAPPPTNVSRGAGDGIMPSVAGATGAATAPPHTGATEPPRSGTQGPAAPGTVPPAVKERPVTMAKSSGDGRERNGAPSEGEEDQGTPLYNSASAARAVPEGGTRRAPGADRSRRPRVARDTAKRP